MPANFEDVAVFHTSMFFKIYKKRKYEMSNKIPVVKISFGDKCIYRRVELVSCKNFHQDLVGITYKSMGELTNYSCNGNTIEPITRREGDEVNITITPTGVISYYFYHPNSATRMSFRIGAPSLIIGVASLIVSVISFFS